MAETWKYFLIEVTYQVPEERVNEVVGQHRAFLQEGYDRGWLLMSGPQVPRIGGIIVGRAPSRQDIEQFFSQDPYQVQGIATYRFVEFIPVKRQTFLESWMTE